jgi:hypothetical protein
LHGDGGAWSGDYRASQADRLTMDDRIILRELIGRLEKGVGPVDQGFFSSWEGDEEKLAARASAGKVHFAQALLYAREALSGDDEEEIRIAAKICGLLERTGKELAETAIKKQCRSAGGKTRGQTQADKAELAWEPYVTMFKGLVLNGIDPRTARQRTKKAMEKADFVISATGLAPSKTSIRERLCITKK